jgi:repressor LexA
MALTKRQKEVLDFIADFVEKHGYSPSYEELAQGLNLASLATVHKHIQALESRNYLRRGFNQSRSLEVSAKYLEERRQHARPQGSSAVLGVEVPLAGRIAAGKPVEALENQDVLQFADFVGKGETYGLQVSGDSMIEDHICNGDYVLIEKTKDATDGEIVVALVDGSDATLKRFYREPGGKVRLQPANSTMQPIFVDAQNVSVQGRVLAVLRKYK